MPGSAGSDEYREAMLRGASLTWEERWEPAATAYRRALAARPDDPSARRQLTLALSRAGSREPASAPLIDPPHGTEMAPGEPLPADGAALGRTLRGHAAELSLLPHEGVRMVVEGLQTIERHQEAGRYEAAFEDAFALLRSAPTFLPLHALLADLYGETGQWQAARDKLAAVEEAYAARAIEDRGAAAA